MSSSTSKLPVEEYIPEDVQGDPVRTGPEFPKLWSVQDPFQYAPPKPDGDHWTMLLEPLLKEDRMRCDAWKDEVQNLLIFAGLFSAVVTAFIIESYQNLQPNPNDLIIKLLTDIATNSPNTNFSSPPPIATQFSPTASSIRINTFWFLSLVLSLATVLIGIISLQWLREHQSYPNLSPREIYAVYNMRAEGLVKWHVDRIFTALPLLLQFALILFLGGIIDFLNAFGDRIVFIPVTVVVAFTLLFLVATTLLPSMQVLFLYFDFSKGCRQSGGRRTPPSQCPYKSPQSHAIRTMWRPIVQLCHEHLNQDWRTFIYTVWHKVTSPFSNTEVASIAEYNLTGYLHFASLNSNWIDFDVDWLAIRDGYMRRTFGRSLWNERVGRRDDQILPIHDLVDGLCEQKDQRMSSSPAYHAFTEISELTLLPLHRREYESSYDSAADRCCQSAYLHDLLDDREATLSNLFILDDLSESWKDESQTKTGILPSILHQQNVFLFLHPSFNSLNASVLLYAHRAELVLRLMRYFFQEKRDLRTLDTRLKFPSCLVFGRYHAISVTHDEPRERSNAIAWQVAELTYSLLQQLDHPNSLVNNVLAQQSCFADYIQATSHLTLRALQATPGAEISTKLDLAIKDKFHTIFSFIEDGLTRETSSWLTRQGQPSLLFYVAAIYAHAILSPSRFLKTADMANLDVDANFVSMRSTLCSYKSRTIDLGIVDPDVEKRLCPEEGAQYFFHHKASMFSAEWWDAFDIPDSAMPSSNSSRTSLSIVTL